MNEESILKRTLILTGKLVGIFSIWITLVSIVVTVVAARAVGGSSGGAAADQGALVPAESSKKDEGAGARSKNPPANTTGKPNG
jgi:hypothetical protein